MPTILRDAQLLALFDQGIKHGEFHLALQHAAAHQPKVQFNAFRHNTAPDQDRHQAVVAKFVGQSSVKGNEKRGPERWPRLQRSYTVVVVRLN